MSEPDFQLFFQTVPGAYLVLHPDFTVAGATDAYLAVTKRERQELIGRPLFSLFEATESGEWNRTLRASLENVVSSLRTDTMPIQKLDLHSSGKDGGGTEVRYWNPVNTPVVIDGSLRYIIHAVEDVTNSVRLEALTGQNDRTVSELSSMRAADREKDEFIAIISHELRTPMTSILGWTRMLALGGLDEATRAEALDALERSTLAQAKLIEDLLDESRISSGKLHLDMRALDLRTIIDDVLSMARPSAMAKSVAISVESTGDALKIQGDPARLQQAIGNLVGNAIKFTGEGGRVTLRGRTEEGECVIEVSDSGRGISPEFLPHVFERFRQGELQPVDRQSGLGLGLSITRHLVEMHGGSVAAESRGEGEGSTFTMRLPLHAEPDAKTDLIDRDAAMRAGTLPRLQGVRVLLIEDEVDNRRVLSTALTHCGADVACVGTAAGAFDLMGRWHPDVLVCDIALPDLDGCSFLSRLRVHDDESWRSIPALALTVFGRAGEKARIEASGFDVFRQKPIDPVDLAHEVERLARLKRTEHS